MRGLKIALIASVAAYCVLGALANLADWPRTLASVGGVLSMATVPGGATHWQATTNSAIVMAGACFIVLFKVIAGLTCIAGAWRMWRQRSAEAAAFARAKALALAGCGVAILGLFVAWVVIAEQVFDLWRSTVFAQSANTAFRYGGFIALIALFVNMRDGQD